jgi:hypothetical protein
VTLPPDESNAETLPGHDLGVQYIQRVLSYEPAAPTMWIMRCQAHGSLTERYLLDKEGLKLVRDEIPIHPDRQTRPPAARALAMWRSRPSLMKSPTSPA